MKKVVLLISVVLFLACSDLSVSKQEALQYDLPTDFILSDYAKINNDVVLSQIIFAVKDTLQNKYGYTKSESFRLEERENCTKYLSDREFTKKLYLEYIGCPEKGWGTIGKCPEEYSVYSMYDSTKDEWSCRIGDCYSGGWDETCLAADNPSCLDETLTDVIDGMLDTFESKGNQQTVRVVGMMCNFILPKAPTIDDVKNYIENFTYDSLLIEEHYHLLGRYEGRPYRYCNDVEVLEPKQERSPDLELVTSFFSNKEFYNYDQYSFCLDTIVNKVYVMK